MFRKRGSFGLRMWKDGSHTMAIETVHALYKKKHDEAEDPIQAIKDWLENMALLTLGWTVCTGR